jgi:hypothetical protein
MLNHYTHNFITITNQQSDASNPKTLQVSRKQLGASTQLEGRGLSSRANRRVIKGAVSSQNQPTVALNNQSMRTSIERTLSNGVNGVTCAPEDDAKHTTILP